MAKIMLVGAQDWTTKDRETGEPISGRSYIGILPTGQAVKFTSKEEYPVHIGEVVFDPLKAVEITLLTKFFGGKISYQDGKSYGQDQVEVEA